RQLRGVAADDRGMFNTNRLSIRARLFVLCAGAVGALVILGGTAIVTTQGMTSQSDNVKHDQAALKVLNHAYASWLLDDDQSNMYAAVLALNDPSQHALAETTWAQAVAGYNGAVKDVSELDPYAVTAKEKQLVAGLKSNLQSYNGFSQKLRADARTGKIHEGVHVVTVENLKPSNALPVLFSSLRDDFENNATVSQASLKSKGSSGTLILIVVALLATPFVLGLILLIMRSISASLRRLLEVADRIAEGDLSGDEGGAGADEIGKATEALRTRIVGYLKPIADAADSVAGGDLTVDVEPTSERDTLGKSVSGMIASLRSLISELQSAGSQVAGASEGLAGASDEAGRAVSEIASAVGQVAEGATKQAQMVDSSRSAAEQTAEAAARARSVADEGIEAATQASNAMALVRDSSAEVTEAIESLARKSEQIGGIVETITGIAGQTNLLALNAAIEAARAGEQGRGFAVVAEEVRKLAEESQAAAATIAELIDEIQTDTAHAVSVVEDGARRSEEGVAVVEQTRDAFQRIGGSVEDVTGRIGGIADAMSEVA